MLRTLIVLVLAAVAVGAAALAWGYWNLDRAISADMRSLLASASPSATTVTSAMLEGLPAPARRYLEKADVVGKPIPSVVRLRQSGRIRSSPDAAWMELEAEEIYSTDPPAFVWRAWLPRRSLPMVIGRDEYLDGAGSILMKMGGLFPVADEHGAELAAAGLMRYLNEMVWFPAAFLGPNVAINARDAESFDVTIADRGVTATATMFVDAEGNLTNFRALRFNTSSRSIETWETPFAAHGTFEGVSVPTAGAAVWKFPAGDFAYIELEITALTYDRALP